MAFARASATMRTFHGSESVFSFRALGAFLSPRAAQRGDGRIRALTAHRRGASVSVRIIPRGQRAGRQA